LNRSPARRHCLQTGARYLTTRDEGGGVIVEVADNGKGIAPTVLPKIFESFFTTKEAGKGTGLGLSICTKSSSSIYRSRPIGKGTAVLLRGCPLRGSRACGLEPSVTRCERGNVGVLPFLAPAFRKIMQVTHPAKIGKYEIQAGSGRGGMGAV
jgi:hypothetical protein